jgi:hypothetical protein
MALFGAVFVDAQQFDSKTLALALSYSRGELTQKEVATVRVPTLIGCRKLKRGGSASRAF